MRCKKNRSIFVSAKGRRNSKGKSERSAGRGRSRPREPHWLKGSGNDGAQAEERAGVVWTDRASSEVRTHGLHHPLLGACTMLFSTLAWSSSSNVDPSTNGLENRSASHTPPSRRPSTLRHLSRGSLTAAADSCSRADSAGAATFSTIGSDDGLDDVDDCDQSMRSDWLLHESNSHFSDTDRRRHSRLDSGPTGAGTAAATTTAAGAGSPTWARASTGAGDAAASAQLLPLALVAWPVRAR